MPLTAKGRRTRYQEGWLNRLIAEGKFAEAQRYAKLRKLDLPPALVAALKTGAQTGGEGVAQAPSSNNQNQSIPSGNFSQLGSVGELGALVAKLERDLKEARGLVAKAVELEHLGLKGATGEVVNKIEEWGAKVKVGKEVANKISEAVSVKSDSQMTVGEGDGMSVEKRERLAWEASHPLPEEGYGVVEGECLNQSMMVLKVDTVGGPRSTSVYTSGYNLQVGERLKVRVAERIGADAIYEVMLRMGNEPSPHTKTNDGLTVAPVGFANQVAPRPSPEAEPEPEIKDAPEPIERSLEDLLAAEREKAMVEAGLG